MPHCMHHIDAAIAEDIVCFMVCVSCKCGLKIENQLEGLQSFTRGRTDYLSTSVENHGFSGCCT